MVVKGYRIRTNEKNSRKDYEKYDESKVMMKKRFEKMQMKK